MERLAPGVGVRRGFHGTHFGKGRARPGRGAVRVPGSLLRAASRLLTPAGCGPACATAAWSPRSWPGRSSRSSRAPCSTACSMSSYSVSPVPESLPWGPAIPQGPPSPMRGLGERGRGDLAHAIGGAGYPHPNSQTNGAKPPAGAHMPPTGQLPRQGASLPSRGLSSHLPMMRRVLQSHEVS